MYVKTLSKLCKLFLVLSLTFVITNGYSVQAEQGSQSLYIYVLDTYSKEYVDIEAAQKELSSLQEQYRIAEHNNLQAESFQALKEYSSTVEKEINIKIDDEVSKLQKEQSVVSEDIETGIMNLTPKQLSILNRKYSKYQEDIDSVLKDKTSISSLFGNATYDKIDTSNLEVSIEEQRDILSYSSDNNNTNLGEVSKFYFPANYSHILTSRAGYRTDPIDGTIKFHDGTDYAMPVGTELYSLFNGTIVDSGINGGYGESIKIDCGNGIVLLYAHLNSRSVNVGDQVTQNQVIGFSGNTGRSTGPHLHLSLFYKGEVLDIERLFS